MNNKEKYWTVKSGVRIRDAVRYDRGVEDANEYLKNMTKDWGDPDPGKPFLEGLDINSLLSPDDVLNENLFEGKKSKFPGMSIDDWLRRRNAYAQVGGLDPVKANVMKYRDQIAKWVGSPDRPYSAKPRGAPEQFLRADGGRGYILGELEKLKKLEPSLTEDEKLRNDTQKILLESRLDSYPPKPDMQYARTLPGIRGKWWDVEEYGRNRLGYGGEGKVPIDFIGGSGSSRVGKHRSGGSWNPGRGTIQLSESAQRGWPKLRADLLHSPHREDIIGSGTPGKPEYNYRDFNQGLFEKDVGDTMGHELRHAAWPVAQDQTSTDPTYKPMLDYTKDKWWTSPERLEKHGPEGMASRNQNMKDYLNYSFNKVESIPRILENKQEHMEAEPDYEAFGTIDPETGEDLPTKEYNEANPYTGSNVNYLPGIAAETIGGTDERPIHANIRNDPYDPNLSEEDISKILDNPRGWDMRHTKKHLPIAYDEHINNPWVRDVMKTGY